MNKQPLSIAARLSAVSWLLAYGAMFAVPSIAHAVCVPSATVVCIADQPIQSTNIVKPNVMFVLDNSGSMDWDYMPDSSTTNDARRRNFQYNTIYYNPNHNYANDIPQRPDSVTGAIVSMGSQTFTNAQRDPFRNPASRVNLSTNFISYAGESTARPAFYCKKIGTAVGAAPCNKAGYQLVTVGANSCQVSGDVTQCPTGADERVNFANWYSYARTRILMMKSGLASAFAPLGDKYRVGLYTINNSTSNNADGAAIDVRDFSGGENGTPKGTWYSTLFAFDPDGGTPLQNALGTIGRYYSGNPENGLTNDPIQYSCQKNFTILSTDGGWNGGIAPGTAVGNADKTVPATMPIKEGESVYDPAATGGLVVNANFPDPYYEGGTASTDTLADYAMYYWVNDLRTAGPVAANNVPTSLADPAYWQHMSTFTIGLGVSGTRAFPGDWAALQPGGALDWPAMPNGDDTDNTKIVKFDDLWHTAVNGHGQYYPANEPASLARGLTAALNAITGEMVAGVAAASSTSDFRSPDETDFTTYAAKYNPATLSGDISKYAVDRTSGLKSGLPLWSASKQLDSKVNPGLTSTVNTTAYTTRKIVTRKEDGVAVEFTYDTLSSNQKTALCYKASPGTGSCISTAPDNASLVNYLRGDASFEGDYGIVGKRFRNRHDTSEGTYYKRDLMGTTVNAKPAYVAVERRIYQEGTDPGFDAFKTANLSRSPVLYVPANDGMVHALDAGSGDELWAYIPSFVIPTGTDDNGFEKGLRAFSYQNGGAPAYNHHFYVDATPGVEAVDFNRSTGVPIATSSPSGDWRSILVGGLGKGGKGYYALDVTSPASTVTAAKSAVLWEFPSAADTSHAAVISGGLMGYSFGIPIVAKTDAWGWVVIVPSGYNNSDGFGYIFVLNAKTGALLFTAKTPSSAPGLAHITTLAKTNNRIVTQVYGGDLNGALWRFDLAGTAPPSVGEQIFSSSSNTPITSEPNVSVDTNTGDRWVFFGTGKYLDVADRTTAIPSQYLVALRDGKVDAPRTTGGVVTLAELTPVTNLLTGVTSAPKGWKHEMSSHAGERVVIKPVADLRTVVFGSTIPTTDPCSPGLVGYAYGLEYSTGKSRLMQGSSVVPSYYAEGGIAGIELITSGKDSATGSKGDFKIRIDFRNGGSVGIAIDPRKISSGTRHVGWRELLNEY